MALVLQHIARAFGGVHAVEDVSVRFEPGRVSALIGPNGAGKTTLFNLVSGFLRLDEGIIHYREERLDGLAPWRIAQHGIGRLFQDVRLFNRMTVLDNVRAAFPRQRGESVWWSLLRRPTVRAQEESLKQRALELLASVELADRARDLAENLSFGQQKLVALARLLAADAHVLLLDEPTAGVAPHLVPHLLGIIREIAADGRTVIVIEHNMAVVTEVADHVYFMDKGRIVASGLPVEVLEHPSVRAAYLGVKVAV
ncbi:MAG: ATP-binding cassette domain-containing protein [Bacteroidota bacterium]